VSGAASHADFELREADWVSVEEASSRILSAAVPLPTERLPVGAVSARALAEPVVASATLPPWDNSAMDGYAVRGDEIAGASADTPIMLPVAGVVRAGDADRVPLQPGQAMRIMTGAPVPPGADTVVRVEDTDREADPGTVTIRNDRDRGRHVRAAGQDMTDGMTLLAAGHAITPGVIGVIAAAGFAEIAVHRVPRVAVLATGDELRRVQDYADVRAGLGVPESNSPMLAAAVRDAGAEALQLDIALDSTESLRQRLAEAADAEVLITIGGASMGEADLVKRVLDQEGFEQDFWRVRMRPGSPISFGWLPRGDRRQAVFSLPGNPSSAFVTFEVFVRPYLLRLAGHERVHRRVVPCRARESFDTPADLTYFQRVSVDAEDGKLIASLTGPQLSGLVRGLASADGLAIVPPHRTSIEPGEMVDVMLLDAGPAPCATAAG
jgi:molybdopterin molybdotransferase